MTQVLHAILAELLYNPLLLYKTHFDLKYREKLKIVDNTTAAKACVYIVVVVSKLFAHTKIYIEIRSSNLDYLHCRRSHDFCNPFREARYISSMVETALQAFQFTLSHEI
jgi:hypothetical protein